MVTAEMEPVVRLTQDLAKAARILSPGEARFLVDSYYTLQEYRIASAAQARALTESGEPHTVIQWLENQTGTLEKQILRALDRWTDEEPMGRWAKAIVGIGPVLSAGLLAHIDITKAPTAGHIWRVAGLDPTVTWKKKQKRPWNARLKVLCWKIGESFVKVSGNDRDVYGHLYGKRKGEEALRNAAGEYKEQAAQALADKRIGHDTEAYKWYSQGMLPPAHIHARATRWAVKIFLSHYQAEAYRQHYGIEPPMPYPIAILGHAHMI